MLKSDNANGLFGFTSINPVIIQESSNVSVNIERLKGQFGSATVSWSVYKSSTSSLAVNDFIMATGTVVFDENESEKVYIITLCLIRLLEDTAFIKITVIFFSICVIWGIWYLQEMFSWPSKSEGNPKRQPKGGMDG